MTIAEALRLALRRLRANKVRSGLTGLGVIIGVAAVVALMAVGQGAQSALTQRISSLGTNLLSVQAGGFTGGFLRGAAGSATTLTTEDADALRGLKNVAAVAPELPVGNALIVSGRSNTTTSVTGTTADEARVRGLDMQTGVFLSQLEQARGLRVAVLGSTTASDLNLDPEGAVGSTIYANGIPLQVIGVMQPKGGGFNSPDDQVYVPLSALQARVSGSSNLRSIGVSVASSSKITQVQAEVDNLLRIRHGISSDGTPDFGIFNQAQLLQVAANNAATLRNFLVGIAAIALLVGGIGIANIMLVSVRERTREIGIRKAIGARYRDISRQFLVEAVTVSLAGGVIGAMLGAVTAGPVGHAVKVTATPSWGAVLLAFGSAAVVGIVAGWWPARQAAALDPIIALRYE